MRRAAVLLFLALVFTACPGGPSEKPLSEPGEKLYVVRGKILSRDAGRNTVNVDHEEIRGFMQPMTMDFPVRGAKVESLPADGRRVEAKLHVTERAYWITDVRAIP